MRQFLVQLAADDLHLHHRLFFLARFPGAFTPTPHSLDDSSEGTPNATGIQVPTNLALYRGNSDFDVRQSAVLRLVVLPAAFGRGQKFVSNARGVMQRAVGLGALNSIDTFSTGSPFTPTMTTSLLNTGSGSQWPNRLASGTVSNPTIGAWFNTAAFVSPGNYLFGNSGRNILFGPGTKQFDLSLFKDFAFNESGSRRLQFRAEAFNIANTPQFNNPNASIGNAAAGTISSAGSPLLFQRTSRQIQLAAEVVLLAHDQSPEFFEEDRRAPGSRCSAVRPAAQPHLRRCA